MAGQSDKKNRIKSQNSNQLILIFVFLCLGINVLINLIKIFIYGNTITTKQIVGIVIFNVINYLLYKLINTFRGSYWEGYLIDFLGLNLAIEVLILFHWKFWFLYLIYPGYFMLWGGKKLFAYVSTIGKENPEEIPEQPDNNNKKEKNKQKVKYVKAK